MRDKRSLSLLSLLLLFLFSGCCEQLFNDYYVKTIEIDFTAKPDAIYDDDLAYQLDQVLYYFFRQKVDVPIQTKYVLSIEEGVAISEYDSLNINNHLQDTNQIIKSKAVEKFKITGKISEVNKDLKITIE